MTGSLLHPRPRRFRELHQFRRLRVEALEDRRLLAVDDWLEENDTFQTSSEFGRLNLPYSVESLVLADANDWYRFTMNAKGGASHGVTLTFEHAVGDLNLELFSSSGKRLKTSAGTTDSEQVSLAGLAKGTYYIRVFGAADATNPDYSLAIDVPRTFVDDRYEQNDSRSTARSLDTPLVPLKIVNLALADSHDWYRFVALGAGVGGDQVAIDFEHDLGNLSLEVYDSAGLRIGASEGMGDSEAVSLGGLPAGTYWIHVFGAGGAKNPRYDLLVDPPDPPPGSTTYDIDLNLTGLTPSQQAIFEQAAARWEAIIVGELPNVTYFDDANNLVAVDDVLIDASAVAIDGVGGVLGQSGPDLVRGGSFLPIHGIMEFDTADLAELEADGTLLTVITHEIAHVLGFGTIWQLKGLLAGAGGTNPRFTGRQAVVAYNSIFGTSASAVPVENTGGEGTRDSHWRESIFGNELMTGALGTATTFPLSRVTVASMADLGYKVNLAAADPYSPPAALLSASAGMTVPTISTPVTRVAALVAPPAGSTSAGGYVVELRRPLLFVTRRVSALKQSPATDLMRSMTALSAAEVDWLMADWLAKFPNT